MFKNRFLNFENLLKKQFKKNGFKVDKTIPTNGLNQPSLILFNHSIISIIYFSDFL